MGITALPTIDWPQGVHGEWVLYLKALPDELATRFGLVFKDGCDDLDYTKTASAVIGGVPALFVCHLRCPAPGTTLIMESGPPGSFVSQEFVDELLAKLGMTRDDIEAARTG